MCCTGPRHIASPGVVVQSGLVLARNQDVVAALGLNGPGMGPATSARWFERHAEARQGRSVRRQPRPPATVRCRRCGRHGLVGGPAGPGSTGPSPCGCGDGVAPARGSLRQRLAAVNGIARSLSHGVTLARTPDPPQPVQLCRQWPGAVLQVLQVAAAVERPAIEVAGPAPPIAGLRRARTGVVGLQPASAARPLPNPDPGARVISPGRPVFWRVTRSPPLTWLPGSDQPTKQAGTAKSEPYRAPSPYSPA